MSRIAPLLAVLLGCPGTVVVDDSSPIIGDADTDADVDTDVDTDVQVDCDADLGSPAVGGPDCITETLSCGQTITSTTQGGSAVMTGKEYQTWFCAPAHDSEYSGPERVYSFDHPGTGQVTFQLSGGCGDLSLFAMAWGSDDSCPSSGVSIAECEVGSSTVNIWNNAAVHYLLVVDSQTADEANFALTATCP